MVPATPLTAVLGGLVTYSIFPTLHAKMELTGDAADPIGDNRESLSVQPVALLPEMILVLLPLTYMFAARAGEPLVTFSKLPEI